MQKAPACRFSFALLQRCLPPWSLFSFPQRFVSRKLWLSRATIFIFPPPAGVGVEMEE